MRLRERAIRIAFCAALANAILAFPSPAVAKIDGPFLAHLPDVLDADFGPAILDRMEDGWATGGAIYWSADIRYNERSASFDLTFPRGEADLMILPLLSYKVSIDAFMDNFTAAQRARMIYVHFQEPEDDLFTNKEIAAWRNDVITSCDVVHDWGAKCGVLMQAETLNPANPHSWADERTLDAFMSPAVVNAVDVVNFAFFNFANNPLVPAAQRVEDFMDRHYPGVAWGAGAVGISVKVTPPASKADRIERAGHVDDFYTELERHGVNVGSWWDSYNEPLNRDFLVDKYLRPVLREHSAA